MKNARNKEYKIIVYTAVFLRTSTVIMVTSRIYNFVFSNLDKCNLAQLKFVQKTVIKVFFLVHYFNYAILHFSHASPIPSPSNMNYWSSFAWLFKCKIITYMSAFICYQDVSLGHLFARASLVVYLNLLNKPPFNWYHHFCIKNGKLYIFYFSKCFLMFWLNTGYNSEEFQPAFMLLVIIQLLLINTSSDYILKNPCALQIKDYVILQGTSSQYSISQQI